MEGIFTDHLKLANSNNTGEFELAPTISAEYPHFKIQGVENFSKSQFVNVANLIDEGPVPLIVNILNEDTQIKKVKLTPKTIILLKRIFNTQVYLYTSATESKLLEPIDTLEYLDIDMDEDEYEDKAT